MSLEVLTLEELWRIGNCRVVYDVRFNGNTKFVTLESVKSRDAQRLTKINAEIKNTTNILEKASREQKTGDNEVYLTMAGRLGGLRWARTLLVEEARTKNE